MPLVIDITLGPSLSNLVRPLPSLSNELVTSLSDTQTGASHPTSSKTFTAVKSQSIFTAPADSGVNLSLADIKPSWLDLNAIARSLRHDPKANAPATVLPEAPAQFLFMRHAERVDRCFPSWHDLAFANGSYSSYDLNQPMTLPNRREGAAAFKHDTPITQIGALSAQLIGRAMALSFPPTLIYTSPALRCLQTSLVLARAMQSTTGHVVQVRIEPGLFDYLPNYDTLPAFIMPSDVVKTLPDARTFIDTQYRTFLSVATLWRRYRCETAREHLQRLAQVMDSIKESSRGSHRALIVAHATVFEGALRHLTGEVSAVTTADELNMLPENYPYSSVMAAGRRDAGVYRLIELPFPPLSYLEFSSRPNMQFYIKNKLVYQPCDTASTAIKDTEQMEQHLLAQ